MDILEELAVDRAGAIPMETQLSRQLAQLIASGRVQLHERLPPIRTVAVQLGINQETVRSAYRRLAEQGLVEARRGRGTTVLTGDLRSFGRGRGERRSFMIGVIIPAFSPFYRPVFTGISEEGREDASQLLICDCRDDPDTAVRYLRQLVARGVDGIVVVSQRLPTDLDLGVGSIPPIVFADIPSAPTPSIVFDVAGVEAAVDHLAEHGHRRIYLVSPPASFPNMDRIMTAFRSRVTRSGLGASRIFEVERFGVSQGREAFAALQALPEPPSAVITASDDLAFGVISAAKARGIAVPGDLAVIAYGDTEFSALFEPPLTTITLPAAELGAAAMRRLRQLTAGEPPGPWPTELTTSLTVRASCGDHNPPTVPA